MARTRDQHFVPYVYLRAFATPETLGRKREKRHIFRCDLSEPDLVEDKRIVKVAWQPYFYDLPDDPEQIVEKKYLQKLENDASPVLEHLIESKSGEGLSDKATVDLARFIAALYMRTQRYRERAEQGVRTLLALMREDPDEARKLLEDKGEFMKELAAEDLRSSYRAIVDQRLAAQRLPEEERQKVMPELDELLEQYYQIEAYLKEHSTDFLEGRCTYKDIEYIEKGLNKPAVFHMKSIFKYVPTLTARLLDMHWSIHEYRDGAYRITSDNPLVLMPLCLPTFDDDVIAYYLLHRTLIGLTELDKLDLLRDYPPTAFVLALSPTMELVMSPPGFSYSEDSWNEERAAVLNRLQIIQANHWAFSHMSDFSVVPDGLNKREQSREIVTLMQQMPSDVVFPVPEVSPSERWKCEL